MYPTKLQAVRLDGGQKRLVGPEGFTEALGQNFGGPLAAIPFVYTNVIVSSNQGAVLDFGNDLTRTVPDFCLFHGDNVNEPTAQKAGWVIQHLRDSGLCPETNTLSFALGRQVFRADIFEKAARLRTSTPAVTHEHGSKSEKNLSLA